MPINADKGRIIIRVLPCESAAKFFCGNNLKPRQGFCVKLGR